MAKGQNGKGASPEGPDSRDSFGNGKTAIAVPLIPLNKGGRGLCHLSV